MIKMTKFIQLTGQCHLHTFYFFEAYPKEPWLQTDQNKSLIPDQNKS